MPQLDFTTYLSQLTWFFISFIGIYLGNLDYVIPNFAFSKKTRRFGTFGLMFEKYIINVIKIVNKTTKTKSNYEGFGLNKNIFNNFI